MFSSNSMIKGLGFVVKLVELFSLK